MLRRFILSCLFIGFIVFSIGCQAILTEQVWSENYALLNGVTSSSPQMIDGDIATIGETQHLSNQRFAGWGTGVSIKLPEKKNIRKIVIHSDNIKKLIVYADKGGTALSQTDWHIIKEVRGIKKYPIVIPILHSFPVDHIRIVVSDTSDDGIQRRQEKAEFYSQTSTRDRQFMGNNFSNRMRGRRSFSARIGEIELYGYKAKTDEPINTENKREEELDAILEPNQDTSKFE